MNDRIPRTSHRHLQFHSKVHVGESTACCRGTGYVMDLEDLGDLAF
jgi:hypothetical protein